MRRALMGEILPHFSLESSIESVNKACFDVIVLADIKLNIQFCESSLKGCIQELLTLVRL